MAGVAPHRRGSAAAIALLALAACPAPSYRLVLSYPDQAAYDRARRVEILIAEKKTCAELAAGEGVTRLQFDAHGQAPAIGEVATGRVSFRALVRDSTCLRFLDGCTEVETPTGEDAIRVALATVAEENCPSGQTCSGAICVAVDGGSGDAAGVDRTSTDRIVDGAIADARVDTGASDRQEDASVVVDAAADGGVDAGADSGASDSAAGDIGAGDAAVVDAAIGLSPVTLLPGGPVLALAAGRATETVLYTVTEHGAYRKPGPADPWVECGQIATYYHTITARRAEPDIVYLGVSGEVYVSADGCASWDDSNLGRTAYLLYILEDDTVYAGTSGGLYRRAASTSWTWSHVHTTPLDDKPVACIAADASGQTLLVGTSSDGLLRSTNGGTSWALANNGLTSLGADSCAVARSDPDRMYAAMHDGLYRSDNRGSSWNLMDGTTYTVVAVDPAQRDAVLTYRWNGVRASSDGAGTFGSDARTPAMDLAYVNALVSDPDGSGRWYAATSRGVFTATNLAGMDWSEIDDGLSVWNVNHIAVAAATQTTFLASSGGLLRQQNSGSWAVQHTGFNVVAYVEDVAIDTVDPNVVLAAGLDLMRSTNNGSTFDVLLDTSTGDNWKVNAAVSVGGEIFAGTETRFWHWTDALQTGTSHQIAGASRVVNDLLVFTSGPTTYVVVATASGLYYSTNDGVSFSPCNTGLVSTDTNALARTSSSGLLLATESGLYFAPAIGDPWLPYGFTGTDVHDVLEAGSTLVAATRDDVYWTHGDTNSWTHLPGMATRWPRSLAIGLRGELLVGTDGCGMYRSTLP